MKPEFVAGNVKADCPDCGVPTTFEFRDPEGMRGEFGTITIVGRHVFRGTNYDRILYKLMSCTVCNRPGVAKLHTPQQYIQSALESFWPTGIPHERIPEKVPDYIQKELREAELCMSVEAWRASAAMLRSTLEKTLIDNGYDDRNLYQKIESAGSDGVITSARRQRAQDIVRTLGNDVLHEEWREVTQDEVEAAHKYVARVIEDFYDDRDTVLRVLAEKGKNVKPQQITQP